MRASDPKPTTAAPIWVSTGKSFQVKSESRFYTVGSSARDKVFEAALDSSAYVRPPTSDMDCDIIYSQGTFISYPEGVQTD